MILLKKNKLLIFLFIYLFISPLAFTEGDTGTIKRAPVAPKVKKYDRLKKTVAIINFSSASPSIEADVGRGITDMLVTSLVKSGEFIVVEREKLDKVLSEQVISGIDTKGKKAAQITELETPGHMVVTGMITPKTAIQIGKILNADMLITGRVINFGLVSTTREKDFFIVGLSAHLISTKTGKTLSVSEAHARSKDEINIYNLKEIDFQSKAFISTLIGSATREAVNTLISQIKNTMVSYPWEGNIIKIADNNIYISGGGKVGLHLGDKLVVLKETKRLEDQITGALVKREFELTGEAQIEQLEQDYAVCSIIQGKGIKKNHIVQLKEEYEEETTVIPPSGIQVIPPAGITIEEQWAKYNHLVEKLREKLYAKPREDIKLSKSGIYLSPYKKLGPSEQEIFKELEKEFNILIRLDPNTAGRYIDQAYIYYDVNLYDKAIAMAEKAITLEPTYPIWRSALADFYMSLLRDYDPSSGWGADAVAGIDMLSVIYKRNKSYVDQEYDSISQAIREKHGITKSDIERWRWEYIRNTETYLELAGETINPEERENTIVLIVHLSNIDVWKNYDKCIVMLSDMAKTVKDNALIWNALGTAYGVKSLCEKKKEAMDKAEECAKKAVSLSPQDRWFHEQLAIIYSLKGGYYTDGTGVSTIYLLNSEADNGLGYEPKFLYPDPAEREKYKALAIKEIAVYKNLSKKEYDNE